MKIYEINYKEENNIPTDLQPFVAIGNFDGIHLGHQQIITQCIEQAKTSNNPSGIIFFTPHPMQVIKNESKQLLTTMDEKLTEIKNLGIENVFIINFTKEFSQLEAKDFIEDILIKQIGIKHLFTGFNFRFGKNRKGDLNLLKSYNKNFQHTAVEKVRGHNFTISSSKIRELLRHGAVGLAAKLLGKHYSFAGKVIKGKQVAGTLGAKTANVLIDKDKCLPILGVYVAKVELYNNIFPAVCNIGVKPTFDEVIAPLLEVHLLDFQQNIYDKDIKVNLLQLLRLERKFDSIDALSAQIKNDISLARYVYNNI